jgi:hypothetical protein
MQIQIRYPFSLRGVPAGSRSEKYIFASYDHTHDVPSIHAAEAPVVLTARYAYKHGDWHTRFSLFELERKETPIFPVERSVPFEVRKFKARYFTYFCQVDEVKQRLLHTPRKAGSDVVDYIADTITTISKPMRSNPLASFCNEVRNSHGFVVGNGKRDGFQWVTWIDDTFPSFHLWVDSLSAYRIEDVIEAEDEYRALSSKLILIGDEAWLEAGLPCINVRSSDKIYVFHDLMTNIPSSSMLDQYFPLERDDDALEYAARYADGKEVVDLRLPLDTARKDDFTFDYEEYRIWRQAQMLAVHCEKCVRSGSKGKLATTATERSQIAAAYEEAAKFKPIFNTKGRPEEYLYELTSLASRFDRKWLPGFAYGGGDKPIRKRFLAETLEMFDNRPIHLYRLND